MSKYLPLAIGSLCVALLALGVLALDPGWLPHHPLLEQNVLLPSWTEIVSRKEQLQQLENHINHVRETKRQIVQEILAGRRSLREAIGEFQKLDQPWLSAGSQQEALQGMGKSEYEWCGLNVIASAKELLADHPDEAAAVAERLQKELQKLLADREKQHPRLADSQIKPAR